MNFCKSEYKRICNLYARKNVVTIPIGSCVLSIFFFFFYIHLLLFRTYNFFNISIPHVCFFFIHIIVWFKICIILTLEYWTVIFRFDMCFLVCVLKNNMLDFFVFDRVIAFRKACNFHLILALFFWYQKWKLLNKNFDSYFFF